MSTQFEFHLTGADAPHGELEADQLLAIVAGLKAVATKIGRVETDAEALGRVPQRTQRVAKLLIGLQPGSTRVLARRAGPGDGSLDFDLAEERAFDERFADLVEAIAIDERPSWVGDSLSRAAADLTGALRNAAPRVEFKVDGTVRRTFSTSTTHRETWSVEGRHDGDQVTFVGQLFAVNLRSHRLQVQDDVGHQIALPQVADDKTAASLIGTHVVVTGTPERDADGTLTHLHDAIIVTAPDPLSGSGVPASVPLDDILASAPGLEPGGIEGLTDDEFDAFFAAMDL
ncbi:hypothetical protein [Nocardioides zeae]|uniref:Uncharacterized protein n=1 Tax=Nocardioides zeae TaxID=1457234 RepID=A0AAJ1U517_9ACTN|nr:hypothetical protein [Nocardioides zeae]MDQ1106065.1 hypothetical protein [Nocardioides zeae]